MRCQCDLGFFLVSFVSCRGATQCMTGYATPVPLEDAVANFRCIIPSMDHVSGTQGGPKISLLRAGIYLRDALITRLSNYTS